MQSPTKAPLQRRAPYQARKGRCSTSNCCMSFSLDRGRFKETCSSDRPLIERPAAVSLFAGVRSRSYIIAAIEKEL
ncbi:hypothetical protein CO661_13630 [Sinorhizobium fredii]|uniref:Uncharacterized protein n=1 Tax=Rhizobium fredii TaxID=380 RepID=A0A2A6LYA4_RHIFR|nr:hypothetical protein CO661_13630 [Sinorhizobium fredii]UTY48615.1 hypothetical protein EPK84_18480 [Sinorhizobium fredii]